MALNPEMINAMRQVDLPRKQIAKIKKAPPQQTLVERQRKSHSSKALSPNVTVTSDETCDETCLFPWGSDEQSLA